jgi:hypothetical protein
MALILKHQTPAELVARFREAYRNAQRDRLVQLARGLLARIAAGDITDAQCRSAFGLTTTQWNTLKTKMNNYIAAHNTVQGAVGE